MGKYIFLITFIVISTAFSQGLNIHCSLRASPEGDTPLYYCTPIWFGWDLDCGDFNGDGFTDVIVSAPRSERPDTIEGYVIPAAGRIDIFFGPLDSGLVMPDFTIYGESQDDQFGISVSNAGDFNGDGYDDILVGANVVSNIGATYVFLGGPVLDTIPDWFVMGEQMVDNFGYSCTGIGDQNFDGYDDIMIGALYNDFGGYRCGRCYLYYGGVSPDTTADLIITGLDSLDDFGTDCDGPLDFDGDGGPDFIVGAVQAGGYWYKPGTAYIFRGGDHLDSSPDRIFSGTHPMEFFGGSVAALGDIDHDGTDEAITGGYNHSEPSDSGTGRAVLVFGDGDSIVIIGDRPNQYLGGEVGSAGDIDMDGMAEFAVSMDYDPAGDSAGFIEIYGWNNDIGTISVDTSCYNPTPEPNDWFASSMKGVGDVTGDGVPNFAVGDAKDTLAEHPEYGEGVVYIYTGWRSMDPIRAEVIEPSTDSLLWYSCPEQNVIWRLRHPSTLSDLYARIAINSVDTISTDSPSLYMDDESTLVYLPSSIWPEGENEAILFEARRLSTGESLLEPSEVNFLIDLTPPRVVISPDSGVSDDRDRTFIWHIEDLESGINGTLLKAYIDADTISPFSYYPDFDSSLSSIEIQINPSDFDFIPEIGDTYTICLTGIGDRAHGCGSNLADDDCVNAVFNRQWTTDLHFESYGLDPTVLTVGALSGLSDGYDPGADLQMPPLPMSRVNAYFSIDDTLYPHIQFLQRDLRDAADDKVDWNIVTLGTGHATLTWNPDRLPPGVWLLDNRLDMRSYRSWGFELGQTLSVSFRLGPKIRYHWENFWHSWNLVGLPIYPECYDPDVIIRKDYYPSADILYFSYNTQTGIYEIPERWPTGAGMWVWQNSYSDLYINGWPIDTIWKSIYTGWNLLAAPFDYTPSTEIGTEPPGVLITSTLFAWDGFDYYWASALYPGYGYWVVSTTDAELTIPLTSFGAGMAKSTLHQYLSIFGTYPPPPPEISSTDEKNEFPRNNSLSIYPNPFNTSCQIKSSIPHATVRIYDISGKLIFKLKTGNSGNATWTPYKNSPSGIYLIKINEEIKTKGIILR